MLEDEKNGIELIPDYTIEFVHKSYYTGKSEDSDEDDSQGDIDSETNI
jgi:hypothetical protein